MQKMMDQINPDLKFDLELEEDFEDMKLPTLDTAIWMGRTEDLAVKINYQFYEKPRNSVFVIPEKSAMDSTLQIQIHDPQPRPDQKAHEHWPQHQPGNQEPDHKQIF